MSPTIRPMRADNEAERAGVIDLLWALNRFEAAIRDDRALDREAAALSLAEDEARIAETGGALLVATAGGEILGFLALAFDSGVPYVRAELRAHGYVMELVVAEAARRRGIGTALLAEAERITRAEGLRSLRIGVLEGNAGAERAYRRAGFSGYALEMIKPLE